MKFIHAADIHLDSPLTGLGSYADAPVEQLRSATRNAFTQLVDHCVDQAVDFLVIAGDLYDGSWKDYNTGIFFCREMGRLKRANIPVYLLFGNHDAESEMTMRLELPDNVHTFKSGKPVTFRIDALSVALHGQSFKEKVTLTNLAANYPAPVDGYFNIGVLHTALEGYAAHANYAPCSIAELHARGYQYWALGHVHEFAQWNGASIIVFPGNLQGRHVRESGRRGAVVVTVADDGVPFVERLFIDVLRWEEVRVDVGSCEKLPEIVRNIGTALGSLLEVDPQVPRAVRVRVQGRTKAHGALFGRESQLRSEVLAQIAAIGNDRIWLENVRLETEYLVDDGAAAQRNDAFSDLQQILTGALNDPEFTSLLKNDLLPFVNKAPFELQSLSPLFEQVRDSDLQGLVQSVAPGLLAQLAQSE